MPQPPPTHIPTRVEVARLLLPRLRRRPPEQRPEPAFPSDEPQQEMDRRELRRRVRGEGVGVGEVAGAGEEALVAEGYFGDFVEAVLDGGGGDIGGCEF